MEFARGDTVQKLEVLGKVGAKDTGHQGLVQARSRRSSRDLDLHYDTLAARLRELVVPEQGRDDHAHRRARTPGKSETFHAKGGLIEFVAFLNRQQEGAASRARSISNREGRCRHRARAAVQRRLQRERLLLRQQHQHARGRNAPHRLQPALTRTINAYAAKGTR